ncbi:MAG: low molecular weight phosphatase family protein [Nevskia sp.]|nr:low molecular weight phosphatase family protein [Nevskia sp.]
MKRLLFLCTGNYYRSRYAELLFNALAPAAAVPWQADSRGLNLGAGIANIGPLSRFAAQRLEQRGIALPSPPRFPQQVTETDLVTADLVIALKEAEHRPLLAANFSGWVDRIEYWGVHDLDQAPPQRALADIEANVDQLLARLAAVR